jgi:hypothetical protein
VWDIALWTYINDTFSITSTLQDARWEQQTYLNRLAEWKFVENVEKRVEPTQVGEWLGFELDSMAMEVRMT